MIEEKTDVSDGAENILKFMLDRLEATQEKLDGCYDYLGPSINIDDQLNELWFRGYFFQN